MEGGGIHPPSTLNVNPWPLTPNPEPRTPTPDPSPNLQQPTPKPQHPTPRQVLAAMLGALLVSFCLPLEKLVAEEAVRA